MTHLIDNDPVAELTKLAQPLAVAVAAASVEKVFTDALVPVVTRAAAQATEASARAEQTAADTVAIVAEVEKVAAVVQADLEKLADDIHAELDQFKPTQGGYAYVRHATAMRR